LTDSFSSTATALPISAGTRPFVFKDRRFVASATPCCATAVLWICMATIRAVMTTKARRSPARSRRIAANQMPSISANRTAKTEP